MTLSLRIPRVEVFWGDVNLTSYQGTGESDPLYGEPLVYNATVNLSENGQNPSGSMNWNPTGAAYAVYEKLVKEAANRIITIRYYYLDGRSITFAFVWSGQQENYGSTMELKVSLSSELDGLTNGIIRSTAQADEKGVSISTSIKQLEKFYGVEKYNLIDFTEKAKKDTDKAKVQANYETNTKFYEAVSGLAENNGNLVFPSNIVFSKDTSQPAAKCIIFTPYAWDKDTTLEELSPNEQFPDPKKRYGYFLGPCLIDSITKQSQWQPPQKRQVITVNQTQQLQPRAGASQGGGTAAAGSGTRTATGGTQGASAGGGAAAGTQTSAGGATGTPQRVGPTGAVQAAQVNSRRQPGATGSSRSHSRTRARLADNQEGEEKKLQNEKEHQNKLSATLFMAPVFTGLKPYDILFIPNFSGTFMEDWIVNTVEYSQTDGGVTLTVQASRHYGLAEYMNKKQGEIWLEKAKSYGLVGENGTLENWMNYGWKPGTATSTAPTGSTSISGGIVPPPPAATPSPASAASAPAVIAPGSPGSFGNPARLPVDPLF